MNNTTIKENSFFDDLKKKFALVIKENNLAVEQVKVCAKKLSPEEAIGTTTRKDYPILTGKDVMIEARVRNGVGQAFTDAPSFFSGSISDILNLDLSNNSHNRALFIAVINAVLNDLGLCSDTIHCKNKGPEVCSKNILEFLLNKYPTNTKIGIIGYQPSILAALSGTFPVRIMDLNKDNIGKTKENTLILDGSNDSLRDEILLTSDLLLVTGSTICNGTIVNFLPYKDKTYFYGTTLSGAAYLMNLNRICYSNELS